MNRIIAGLVALALSGCSTANLITGEDTSGPVVDALKKDAQVACVLRDQIQASTLSLDSAADLICALANAEVPPVGFTERDATSACVEAGYFSNAPEWQKVCSPRLTLNIEEVLRSMTVAEAYFPDARA